MELYNFWHFSEKAVLNFILLTKGSDSLFLNSKHTAKIIGFSCYY